MDLNLIELLAEGSAVAAVIGVVYLFIRHISTREDAHNKVLENIGSECHAHQDKIMDRFSELQSDQKALTESTMQRLEKVNDSWMESQKELSSVLGGLKRAVNGHGRE